MSEQGYRELAARQAAQLLEAGFIAKDENGSAVLTEKGKQRAAKRLDKLPIGDDVLIEIAFCEAHHIGFNPF
ncbi:hypothetical protein L1N85_11230 [Paenibacillus alkaliterrae]|uniref:hypothetical protein n=1 Tax=Paenibacillus alkaliterrae TaxID=320909 RepID=UPI001F338F21|nr:hypothetical protein [Paenibacillus alkaliterrae]MCF2939009.1 hypothetical protein [Paenibacillus alkaliterrae]